MVIKHKIVCIIYKKEIKLLITSIKIIIFIICYKQILVNVWIDDKFDNDKMVTLLKFKSNFFSKSR